MSALAGLLGKLGPKLAGLAEGASQGGGTSSTLIDWGKKLNDQGPSKFGSILQSAGGALESGQTIASRLGQGAGASSSPFSAAGGALSAAGGMMMSSGNPYAMVAGAVAKFAGTLLEGVDKIRNWGNQLHEANMQFAEFSGAMAAVQAQTEIQEFQLKRSQGDNRAESAAYLAGGKLDLDKAMAPLENLWAKIENYVGGTVLTLLSKLLIPLTLLGEVLGGGDSETADYTPGDELLEALKEEQNAAVARRPGRMR